MRSSKLWWTLPTLVPRPGVGAEARMRFSTGGNGFSYGLAHPSGARLDETNPWSSSKELADTISLLDVEKEFDRDQEPRNFHKRAYAWVS